MKALLRSFNKMINPLGIVVKRTNDYQGDNTMLDALKRSRDFHHVNPATIIDIGAAEGTWTSKALNIWTTPDYVLFEPLQEREKVLMDFKQTHKNIHLVNKAAGDSSKEIDFYVTADLDGSGISDNGTDASVRKITVTTIDKEIDDLKLNGPFILKLDTHGYEVPIIEGSEKTLKNTQLLIIECYGFNITPSSLLFSEMCEYLKGKGFRLVDIVDIDLRKKDRAFWQCDAFFIPASSPCFSSNTYI